MVPIRSAAGSSVAGVGSRVPGGRRRRPGFLRRRFLLVVLPPLVAGILAAALAWLMPPVYQASATLVLDADPRIDDGLETQVQVIRSRSLAAQVAEQLAPPRRAAIEALAAGAGAGWIPIRLGRLHPRDDAGQKTGTDPVPDRLVEGLAAGLRVESVGGSRVVRIAFRSRDPGLSADVVDAYLDSIQTLGSEEQTVSTARLAGLRGELDAAEVRLGDYRRKHGLNDAEPSTGVAAAERDASARRLVAARAERDRLQSERDQLESVANSEPAAVAAHPLLARDPVIQALRTDFVRADQAAANLALRYGERHPRMIAARAELEGIRARLGAEIESVSETIDRALASAGSRVEELEQARATNPSRVEPQPELHQTLHALEKAVEIARGRYEQAAARIEGRGAGRGSVLVVAQVLDRPGASAEPAGADPLAIIAGAMLAGLLVGLGSAYIRDAGDDRIHTPEDFRDLVQTPLLGTLPKLPPRYAARSTSVLCFAERPRSNFAEAIRTLRTMILLATPQDPGQVILVTAGVRGEGTSTLAGNLAGALARNARVLLVDADMRRGGIAKRLGLPGETPGLAELLVGTSGVDECIQRAESIGADLIGAGDLPPDPLELLSSRAFQDALAELRRRYDRIVIDSPPLEVVSDALILAAEASSVVFVIRAGRTPTALVRASLDRLRRAGAPVLGATLNG